MLLFFEHFGITLPVKDKTLEQLCGEHGLSLKLVTTFANLFDNVTRLSDPDLSIDDTKAIILYLKNSHEFYSREIYPDILKIIEQMTEVNDSHEMSLVKKFFTEYFNEVNEHLDYENKVVFPYVLDLFDRVKKGEHRNETKEYSVVEYRDQHNDIEEKLDDLKKLLIKYLPQKNDRILRRKLLYSLFELDYDLKVHSQIEEFILIPLVEKMESHLKRTQ